MYIYMYAESHMQINTTHSLRTRSAGPQQARHHVRVSLLTRHAQGRDANIRVQTVRGGLGRQELSQYPAIPWGEGDFISKRNRVRRQLEMTRGRVCLYDQNHAAMQLDH